MLVVPQLKKDETKIYSVTVEEDLSVGNLKPAVVKVYDYYQASKSFVFSASSVFLFNFSTIHLLISLSFPTCVSR